MIRPPNLRESSCAAVLVAFLLGACATKTNMEPAQAQQPPQQPAPVKAVEATPQQRAMIRTELAAGYYERGQLDVALEELGEAQKLDPTYAKTYNIYGLVYTMTGEQQKAEDNFRHALALAPNDSEIRHNWGAFLCATGRAKESIAEFDQVLRNPLYRSPEIALINAGKCSAEIGDMVRADDYLRRALAAAPSNPAASFNLALIMYREGKLGEARSYMRTVMQQNNPTAEALFLGMCIERKQGDRQAELSYASQLRNRYPESIETKALGPGACQ